MPFIIRETYQRRRVTIMFHHNIDPETLEVQLEALHRRYNLVALRDCVEALRSGRIGSLPPKPLVLTFDDGWRGNFDLLEVFRKYSVTPTIFLCSGVAGTHRRFWWTALDDATAKGRLKIVADSDRMEWLSRHGYSETDDVADRMALSRQEIQAMRSVVDFQAHTIFHPILTQCDDERAWREIAGSREALKRDFGLDVFAFAYPNGDYGDREVDLVSKAGYACAVTTDVGVNRPRADLYRLKRIGLPSAASPNETIVRACVLPTILRHRIFG